jgi:superfamily II DNA or RNA helicase
MASVTQLFSSLSTNEQLRGRQFESICKWFLENDPEYKCAIKRVWLWKNWPGRWGRDKGIDMVAETHDGKFWAIQSKAYAREHSITKKDVDKFLSESSRKSISYRLLISTAGQIGHNAQEVMDGQEKPVGVLVFSDLKKRKLNWPSSPEKLSAKQNAPKRLRPDQSHAVADVIRGFRSNDRGQLIRACGTGKTLIGLRVAEAMRSRRTLVLVPSLSLVSQTLAEWAKDSLQPFRFLPVCSDETVAGDDHLVSHVREFGLPATTKVPEIADFMRGTGTRVVFSTYQSSPKLAHAFKKHALKPFDLVIADEAHRCAGMQAGDATIILDAKAIPARKRLFMTATPRIASEATKARADSLGMDVVSMDSRAHFGPVFHELKFSDAIRLKLLTDYCVEIIGVDDPLYKRYAEDGVFVTLDGKTITDARTLTSHIALAKAIKKHGLQRVITFHGRVNRAKEFADQFPEFIRWMPRKQVPAGGIWSSLVSGDMASSKRDAILDRLREVRPQERGVVTNARCLSEGVDLPALDGVAFIDPKESQVDIVQAVGRAIRKAERKKRGVIILPVYLSSSEDEEQALEDSSFKQVWRVLRALRAHDDQLASELDRIRGKLGKRGKVKAHLPDKIQINFPIRLTKNFASSFYLRTIRATSQAPPLALEQILRWSDAHRKKIGRWPSATDGEVIDAPGEKWPNINMCLHVGGRGLPRGSSLAKLLAKERAHRNPKSLAELKIPQILNWADAHRRKTGVWPTQDLGDVSGAPGERWRNINAALVSGGRGLPGGSSLAKLLAEKRGSRNQKALPRLTIKQILQWADAHYQKHGDWPKVVSGDVLGAKCTSWSAVHSALAQGGRGLPGGSSLAKLLAEKRGVRNQKALSRLTIKQILDWADLHHRSTGEWPKVKSGKVAKGSPETWTSIDVALCKGLRGLPGGSSLAKLLTCKRGVRNKTALPQLSIIQILKWADSHKKRTGQWPGQNSGPVNGAPGEKWANIYAALSQGLRGLPGGSSLAKLLAEKRGVRNQSALPRLTIKQILQWADAHHRKYGDWPKTKSGDVLGEPGQTWRSIDLALFKGGRGLPGGSSLPKLLANKRGRLARNQRRHKMTGRA